MKPGIACCLKIFGSFACLLLASCASIPTTGNTFSAIEEPSTNEVLVYVYAPDTPCLDFGQMAADIFVDDEVKLTIDEGYYGLLRLAEGSYALHASTDDQMACDNKLNPGRRFDSVQLQTRPGETYFLRYSSHPVEDKCVSTCSRSIQLVDESAAIDELDNLTEATAK